MRGDAGWRITGYISELGDVRVIVDRDNAD